MATFILVHSPLVGPATWRWVAAELRARGHETCVPELPGQLTHAGWQAVADAVAEQAGDCDQAILAGHSGAGPLLPQIAGRCRGQIRALVFVDAAVPPEAGDIELMPEWLLAELRGLADDGLLPPWSDWFGPAVMEELIPDAGKRLAVAAELPRVPVSYFENRVPAPAGWASVHCGYVLLSEAYQGDAATAEARGWPVIRQVGAHLDIVTRPGAIAEAILQVSAC